MKKSDVIHIYTGTYSNKVFDILNRFRNIMLMDETSYHVSTADRIYNFTFGNTEIEPNGEVIWFIEKLRYKTVDKFTKINTQDTIMDGYGIGKYAMFDDTVYNKFSLNKIKIRKWLAETLKNVTQLALYYQNKNPVNFIHTNSRYIANYIKTHSVTDDWNRHSCIVLKKFSGTYISSKDNRKKENLAEEDIVVSDMFCLYDILSGKSHEFLYQNYPKEQLDKIIGVERNPIATEAEKCKREELDKLDIEYNNKIDILLNEYNNTIYKIGGTSNKHSLGNNISNVRKKFDIDRKILADEHVKSILVLKAKFDKYY